jgi:3-isopropylmalate/(R)-2-methylmalate dehydratase large subunit
MQERMTLSNMTAELGGQAGLIQPDEVTIEYLDRVGVRVADASESSRAAFRATP